MLVAKLVLTRLDRCDPDAQIEALGSLLGAYRLDGHVLGDEFRTVVLEDHLDAYVVLPASDAFETRHRNEYIERRILELPNLGLGDPELVLLTGDYAESDECKCLDSSAFILFANYLTVQSPVKCGDCFGQIPLYCLPRFDSGKFVEVLSWASDAACDTLYMNSAPGVRFGYAEMTQFASSLSTRGRASARGSRGQRRNQFITTCSAIRAVVKRRRSLASAQTARAIGCYQKKGTAFLIFAAIAVAWFLTFPFLFSSLPANIRLITSDLGSARSAFWQGTE